MGVDPAVLSLLKLDASNTSMSSAGGVGMSSASTSKTTTTLSDGSKRHYFIKTGKGPSAEVMFRGENASLTAIHSIVPTLCPQSYGHGQFSSSPETSFLVTDYLDLTGRSGSRPSKSPSTMTLAQKLAKLHSTPAPIPAGLSEPQYGFPVPTCCGDTPQDNTFTPSWADFYANHRLRFIVSHAAKQHGEDKQLSQMTEALCTTVVPRLLNPLQIRPVVVHGDLWSGNASVGALPGMSQPEDVIFDSSAVYAHSEFELGIMRMFGGFGGGFLREYHALVPKTEPTGEYEDRVRLYELYHHLNHYALFGGGYRSGGMQIMKDLVGKYGGKGGGRGEE